MTVTNYYKVAGHTFGVSGEEEVFALMSNYAPFVNHGDRSMIAAKLHITRPVPVIHHAPEYTEEMRQEDEGQVIICGHTTAGEAVFEFHWRGVTTLRFRVSVGTKNTSNPRWLEGGEYIE